MVYAQLRDAASAKWPRASCESHVCVMNMASRYLLDLGFIVPITIATGVGLLIRQPLATKALYGVVGWFALMPPSVAAMAIVKVVRDDPVADAGDTVVILAVSFIFAAVAIWLYAPLFRRANAVGALQADEKLAVGHAAPGQ